MDLQALYLTLKLATVTTAVLLVLSLPLAYWLVFSRARWKPLIEAAVSLPLVLPPTVLGFYLLVLLGPRTIVGRSMVAALGHPLAFSFGGLVVGSVLYSFPFAVQPLSAGFAAVDASMLDAAKLLGASPLRVLLTVLLPLSTRSLLSAAVLAFTHTVGEFGVVLMIGGDIPGSTRTLSIAIFDQVQDFNYAQANHTAFLLLAFSFVALLFLYGRSGRGYRV